MRLHNGFYEDSEEAERLGVRISEVLGRALEEEVRRC